MADEKPKPDTKPAAKVKPAAEDREPGEKFSQRVSVEESKAARTAKLPELKKGDVLQNLRQNVVQVRGVEIAGGAKYTITAADANDPIALAKFAAACRPGGMLAKV